MSEPIATMKVKHGEEKMEKLYTQADLDAAVASARQQGENNVRSAMRIILSAEKWGAALGAAAEDESELVELLEHRLAQERAAAYRRCAEYFHAPNPWNRACDTFEQWALEAESQPTQETR